MTMKTTLRCLSSADFFSSFLFCPSTAPSFSSLNTNSNSSKLCAKETTTSTNRTRRADQLKRGKRWNAKRYKRGWEAKKKKRAPTAEWNGLICIGSCNLYNYSDSSTKGINKSVGGSKKAASHSALVLQQSCTLTPARLFTVQHASHIQTHTYTRNEDCEAFYKFTAAVRRNKRKWKCNNGTYVHCTGRRGSKKKKKN